MCVGEQSLIAPVKFLFVTLRVSKGPLLHYSNESGYALPAFWSCSGSSTVNLPYKLFYRYEFQPTKWVGCATLLVVSLSLVLKLRVPLNLRLKRPLVVLYCLRHTCLGCGKKLVTTSVVHIRREREHRDILSWV